MLRHLRLMKGIQKSLSLHFAENSSKYVARATHSNYLMEQKNGMKSEDYVQNIPIKSELKEGDQNDKKIIAFTSSGGSTDEVPISVHGGLRYYQR